MNYAGFTDFEIVIVTLIFSDVVPQLKYAFHTFAWKPLCCLTSLAFITLFSFQGATVASSSIGRPFGHPTDSDSTASSSFEARFEDPIFQLGLQIQQQTLFGGPEWARTTDLTIISRTL